MPPFSISNVENLSSVVSIANFFDNRLLCPFLSLIVRSRILGGVTPFESGALLWERVGPVSV